MPQRNRNCEFAALEQRQAGEIAVFIDENIEDKEMDACRFVAVILK